MVVVVLAVVPERLRGHLTRWLMEISPGVYVGKVSARVRELLWEQIRENCKHGRAIMAYTTDSATRDGRTIRDGPAGARPPE